MSQVAVDHRDLAIILDLVRLIDDLDPTEHRAITRAATRLDRKRNELTTGGQNSRITQPVRTVPCTFSDHHLSGRAATRAGVPPCRCAGDKVVPDFTPEAKTEPLVDRHGWSRAADQLEV